MNKYRFKDGFECVASSVEEAKQQHKMEINMKHFKYQGRVITANYKEEAIQQVIAYSKLNKNEILEKAEEGNWDYFKNFSEKQWEEISKFKDYMTGNTPLHFLAEKRKKLDKILSLPKKLLLKKNKDDETIIHILAQLGNERIINKLISLPKEYHTKDRFGRYPCVSIASRGFLQVLKMPINMLKERYDDNTGVFKYSSALTELMKKVPLNKIPKEFVDICKKEAIKYTPRPRKIK